MLVANIFEKSILRIPHQSWMGARWLEGKNAEKSGKCLCSLQEQFSCLLGSAMIGQVPVSSMKTLS